eukprot:4047997-Pyramimonas_sp.AAC.1
MVEGSARVVGVRALKARGVDLVGIIHRVHVLYTIIVTAAGWCCCTCPGCRRRRPACWRRGRASAAARRTGRLRGRGAPCRAR